MVSQILMEQGFGTQLLAAVYRFNGEALSTGFTASSLAYTILSCRAATTRLTRLSSSGLKSVMGRELPIEKDEAKWYPLWGMPI
jgi:hypothetical protein